MAPKSTQSPSSLRAAQRSFTSAETSPLAHSPRVRAPRRAAPSSDVSTHAPKVIPRQTSAVGTLRSGKVDTNLRSYDRRNPFVAISTLIKLFASLPSRVIAGGGGGCQYKLLTIDEHKLCVHLCNIIEPFILSAAHCDDIGSAGISSTFFKKRGLLMRQPTEILDRIASSIEHREDLMNFGSACKRLKEIVFPRHWEYRVIRAKVSMVGVWKHLYERPDLAANVRLIEVIDERSERRVLVPRVCRKAVVTQGTKSVGGIKTEDVVSATSTDEDSSSTSGSETGEGLVGRAAEKISIHKRQEKYFIAALDRMSDLRGLKWEANHSPTSVLDIDSDGGKVWGTLAEKCTSLGTLEVTDNMVFSPLKLEEESDVAEQSNVSGQFQHTALINLRSIILRATQFPYGAPKQPSMNRIASILHQCPNIQSLEVVFRSSKAGTSPIANEFLSYSRWSHLTTLTLTNLSCFTTTSTITAQSSPMTSPSSVAVHQNPLQAFLSAHPNLEILTITDFSPAAHFRRLRTPLPPNLLPKLRELHAGKDIVNMVLRSKCDTPRPLEVLKGFKLASTSGFTTNSTGKAGEFGGGNVNPNIEFYQNLKESGGSVKRIELAGWGDLDDVRMLAHCVPKLTWLDVGRWLRPANGSGSSTNASSGSPFITGGGGSRSQAQAPVTNMVEWAEVLSGFEELTTFHGVKFFYEISPKAFPNSGTLPANETSTGSTLPVVHAPNPHMSISMTDRSRIKKNDEIAGVLAWKCPRLKRVDHWDNAGPSNSKVIVLLRDSDFGPSGGEGNLNKVRWDVRRVRA